MIYLLIFILIIEILFFYLANKKQIFSVSIIATGMFFISSIVYAIYMKNYYGRDIDFYTVLIIAVSLFFLCLGDLFGKKINIKGEKKENKVVYIKVKPIIIFFLSIFTIIASSIYFFDVYKFSLKLGNTEGNFFSMTEYVRHASSYGTGKVFYSSPILINQMNIISECIVYMCIFIFFYNLFIMKEKNFFVLLPCLGYIIYIVACDSRSNIIRNLTIICCMVFGIMEHANIDYKFQNRKIIRIGITALILFLIVFRILGYRTGTSNNYSFITNIAEYISSGLYGLNNYIMNGVEQNEIFGVSTFRLIYAKLNSFGMHINIGEANDKFFSYYKGKSNIYTGLKGPISDFGIIFAEIFFFFWSLLININLKKSRIGSCSLIKYYIIGIFIFPIVMISISVEWGNVLSIQTIYTWFYISILDFLLLKKEARKVE